MIALQLPLSYSKRGCGSIDNHSSMEQQPLSYVYSMKPGRSYLFAEFLEFICNKLYLGSNDDLYGGLAWTHHASHTGGLDQLFIDLGIILDLKTESGNAVINRSHILRTANAFQNDLRYFREVVIGQSYLGLICIVILTSRSLQIKLGKEKMHPYIAAHSRHDWCTYCSLFYWRKLAGWQLVLHT